MSQLQRDAVVAEALTWLKTPYHHNARLKGVGVDCAQLLCAVYEAAGVVQPVNPGYNREHHMHNREEIFVQWLERAGGHEVHEPGLGDVALWHWGRTWSHGSIIVELGRNPQVVHSYLRRGVVLTRLSEEPLAGRIPRYWSLW